MRVRILYRWKPRILAQNFFLIVGILAAGYVAFIYAARFFHQADQVRSFERALAYPPPLAPVSVAGSSTARPTTNPPIGSLIGKIFIPRLGITAIVDEGVDSTTLTLSVGHIPSTALPGQPGNVGIAGHRDTFFRPLRNIQRNDIITLTTLRGDYRYRVVSIKVTSPYDIAVLGSDESEVLTLVTCYPFYFVGSAPERFIVRAERVTYLSRASSCSSVFPFSLIPQSRHRIDLHCAVRGTKRGDQDDHGQQNRSEREGRSIEFVYAEQHRSDVARERKRAPEPMAMASSTSLAVSPITMPKTSAGRAPIATRMPNSRVRRATR